MEDFSLNAAQQGRFEITLSNLPAEGGDLFKDINLRIFNNFVHGVTVPETTIQYAESNTYGGRIVFPIPDWLKSSPEFSITYGLDENMTNYWYLFNWVWKNKNALSTSNKEWLVESKINEAVLLYKDNNGRNRNLIKFIDCYPSSLSSLDLNYGAYENVKFTVNFKFNGFQLIHFGKQSGTV